MNINAHFIAFLETTVNLPGAKLTQLDGRVAAITNALQRDSVIGAMYKEHIPQGSWAHQTIIRPVGAYDEFDADILLHLEQQADWTDPREYLRQVRAAFKRSSTYNSMVQKKNRCVRIDYANDCHVDVVPCITLSDGRQVIINYADNAYEDTNPAGFSDWMRERDDLTAGNLRRVLRLLKYVRDFKNTFDCPSVILTTLVGGRVQAFMPETRYVDLPTTLVTLLEDLNSWLSLYPSMPLLDDPSCPGTSFNHRWDEAKYNNFKTMIAKYAGWARAALDAGDDRAISEWQRLFGPEFGAEIVEKASKALVASPRVVSIRAPRDRAPDEQFIEEKHHQIQPRYRATIEGRVHGMPGWRNPTVRSLPSVPRGVTLKFKVATDTPAPFQIIWKVRNHGEVATQKGDLRGQLLSGEPGSNVRQEKAEYPGRHYIEVYVVKDGVVVASDHHEVNIR